MLNEKFAFCFKVIIKWKLRKLHASRFKSAKYRIHVIIQYLLKKNDQVKWVVAFIQYFYTIQYFSICQPYVEI